MSAVELLENQTAACSPSPNEGVPDEMRAAVYVGNKSVEIRTLATPRIGSGELLVRVESCGICHTDLKKIAYDLLPAPRIYGHETAGTVVAAGEDVNKFRVGDRVVVFHHIPCSDCFYCDRKLYAQCPGYKKVGVTAGYEAAGGGFSQYVRVMDWIVKRGVECIPAGVSFDQACWIEPVNTCLKATELLNSRPDDVVAVLGQGSIGLIFTTLLKQKGARVIASDGFEYRRALSAEFGADAYAPGDVAFERAAKETTNGRGVDAVILATNARGLVEQAIRISRPGSKILLFAQTSTAERIECSGADVCVGERMLLGSYSANIDLQAEAARLVFSGELPVESLISDRVSLDEITRGIDIAQHPGERSLKVVLHPQERT